MSSLITPDPGAVDTLDLTDPRTHAEYDLTRVWQRLRKEQPFYKHRPVGGSEGFWVVSRYEDVSTLYRDTRRFTSEKGNVLTTLLLGGDSAAGMMAAVTDGPRHNDLRRILLKAFSPRALTGVVENIQAAARQLLLDAVAREECDFARDVAAHIPLNAICDLMAVPQADRPFVLECTEAALGSDGGAQSPAVAWQARNDILAYFEKLATERRRNPGTDAVSLLATGTLEGKPLTMDEIVVNCYSLILGGDETSRLSMTGAVAAFLEHPDQWRALLDGEVEISTAVEEVLRWTTPAIHFGRSALEDVPVGDQGQQIKAGDVVTLWNNSANMDEEVFANPGRFDLARTPNKHIAFGYGPHFCLGAYLGRAEIAAMLTALRDIVTTIEPNGEPRRVYSNLLSGMTSLPVVLRPA
ncbi:cytochrome P450 [Streptomyces qinglanensis]|uniref:Cytochrome P450 n=1 Tax=Streptomyces qinglanensis TaxID=943816 RepID=A0A1H9WNF8_9ACTN|nr:cytochrome P450 [Streptomyces qinglanensis]SES35227.1 Cytochrome P450 [Streptomyces qinglanensis]